MAQKHLDRLSAVDAGFLHQEKHASHMHIGGLAVFEGPAPQFDDFLDHIRGRLPLVPRYRQKLAFPPLQSGRPVWIDDPDFNLEYHVRHTALPAPGDEEQLRRLVARIFAQRLDRTKPLWEIWLIEGLEHGRVGLISKTHHSLVDGVSGAELMTVLFDLTPEPSGPLADEWHPRRPPNATELMAAGVRGLVSGGAGLFGRLASLAVDPGAVAGRAMEAAQGLGEVAWAILNPAPESPLNVEIGPHRRFSVVRCRLDDFKTIKNAFGGTVNDVVLSVVSAALGRWLRTRGVRTEGLELRGLVPVSTRGGHERDHMGNRITVMLAYMPMSLEDPLQRLRFMKRQMDGLKESKQALGADVIAAMENFAPPTILAQASRLSFSSRMYNVLVTNVPGPQFPVFMMGRRLLETFPVAFLAEDHALAVAIMSYNGGINVGLLGDYDALPDIDLIAGGIADALDELLDLARQATAATSEVAPSPPHSNGHARDAAAAHAPARPRQAKAPRRGSRRTPTTGSAAKASPKAAASTPSGSRRRATAGGGGKGTAPATRTGGRARSSGSRRRSTDATGPAGAG